ncbi:MAG: hypothetical protein J1F18_08980 [Lachnospiraceae bacterium]|nr:hypothetical protein [Lachnospiraceae bacterium]
MICKGFRAFCCYFYQQKQGDNRGLYPNAALKPLVLLDFQAFSRAKNTVFAFIYMVFFRLLAEKVVHMRRYAASSGHMQAYEKGCWRHRVGGRQRPFCIAQ